MDDPQDLSVLELLRLCLRSQEQAVWQEFVSRTQPCIAGTIIKTLRRCGTVPSPSLIDDLVQDTYVKLFDNNSKALREFECEHENALFGFLKTVASNVVHDYIRRKNADIHGGGREEVDLEKVSAFLRASSANPNRQILFDQILGCLRHLENDPNFQRDWAIFQLYYFDGLTANAISRLPGIDLKVKGVESTLLRLVRYVRGRLGKGDKALGAAE